MKARLTLPLVASAGFLPVWLLCDESAWRICLAHFVWLGQTRGSANQVRSTALAQFEDILHHYGWRLPTQTWARLLGAVVLPLIAKVKGSGEVG